MRSTEPLSEEDTQDKILVSWNLQYTYTYIKSGIKQTRITNKILWEHREEGEKIQLGTLEKVFWKRELKFQGYNCQKLGKKNSKMR